MCFSFSLGPVPGAHWKGMSFECAASVYDLRQWPGERSTQIASHTFQGPPSDRSSFPFDFFLVPCVLVKKIIG